MKIHIVSAKDAQAAYRNTTEPSQGVLQAQMSGGTAPNRLLRADMDVFSPQGRRRALALNAVQTAPDVDQAAVTLLRGQVKNGTYQVDEQNLAAQLMKPGGIA